MYRATVKSDRGEVNYLGTSDSAFKQRYANHKLWEGYRAF